MDIGVGLSFSYSIIGHLYICIHDVPLFLGEEEIRNGPHVYGGFIEWKHRTSYTSMANSLKGNRDWETHQRKMHLLRFPHRSRIEIQWVCIVRIDMHHTIWHCTTLHCISFDPHRLWLLICYCGYWYVKYCCDLIIRVEVQFVFLFTCFIVRREIC